MNVSLTSVAFLLVSAVLFDSPKAVAQQSLSGVRTRPAYEISVPAFADADVEQLIASLDSTLSSAAGSTSRAEDVRMVLWGFARLLQGGRLSPAQEARVLDHLGDIGRSDPGFAAAVAKPGFMVSKLTIGKVAPEIVGKDLDGAEFRLSDYRGKVVVVMFSGDWCGICRTDYPYERLLLELYKNWPFVIVSVNSDRDRDAARRAKQANGLTYRSWWDGGGVEATSGPIASAWNVMGWPATYVLDERGVIRFVDLRHEDLLKGVGQLLTETQLTKASHAGSKR
jgi:peroxiredoxin